MGTSPLNLSQQPAGHARLTLNVHEVAEDASTQLLVLALEVRLDVSSLVLHSVTNLLRVFELPPLPQQFRIPVLEIGHLLIVGGVEGRFVV